MTVKIFAPDCRPENPRRHTHQCDGTYCDCACHSAQAPVPEVRTARAEEGER